MTRLFGVIKIMRAGFTSPHLTSNYFSYYLCFPISLSNLIQDFLLFLSLGYLYRIIFYTLYAYIMDPYDYTAISRRPANVWTANQRVVLAYLARYENSWREISRIFNSIFQAELPAQEGISCGAVASMWHSMQLNADEKAALARLSSATRSRESVELETITYASIRAVASNLNISLIESNSGAGSDRKRKASSLSTTRISDDRDWSDADPHTPTKRSCQSQRSAYPTSSSAANVKKYAGPSTPETPLQLTVARDLVSLTPKKLATLAFRGFGSGSHTVYAESAFLAGAFRDTSQIPGLPADHVLWEEANLVMLL